MEERKFWAICLLAVAMMGMMSFPRPAEAFLDLGPLLAAMRQILGETSKIRDFAGNIFGDLRSFLSEFRELLGGFEQLRGLFSGFWRNLSLVDRLAGELRDALDMPRQMMGSLRRDMERMFLGFGGGFDPERKDPVPEVKELYQAKARGVEPYNAKVLEIANKQAVVQWGYGSTIKNSYTTVELENPQEGKWKEIENPPTGHVLDFIRKQEEYYKKVSEQLQRMSLPSGRVNAEAAAMLEQMKVIAEISCQNGMTLLKILRTLSDNTDVLTSIYLLEVGREWENFIRKGTGGVGSGAFSF